MRTMKKIFLMAALALVTAASCSRDDDSGLTTELPGLPTEQPVAAAGVPFSATISVDNSAVTRALEENGTTIAATWADGEQVALVYTVAGTAYNTTATVAKRSDGTATISAMLQSGVATGDDVTIIYPATAADGTTGQVKDDVLAAQNGTLTGNDGSIAKLFDVRKGTGKLKVSDGSATVNNGTAGSLVTLTNQNAIFKLTLKNIDATADVQAQKVEVYDETGDLLTTVTPATGYDKVMYVALPPAATALKFLVTGTDGTKYFNQAPGLSLSALFYRSTVKLAQVGDVFLSTGKCAKAGTSGAVAMIAYLGDGDENTSYNCGLAIALEDANSGYSCYWSDNSTVIALSSYTSTTMTDHKNFLNGIDATNFLILLALSTGDTYDAALYGKTTPAANKPQGTSDWFLPSSGQWLKFFEAAGIDVAQWNSWTFAPGGTSDITKVQNLLEAANSRSKFDENSFYWSSSEFNAEYAVGPLFLSSLGLEFSYQLKNVLPYCVRPFIAF